ncbi:hypothetical protein EDD75_2218 [Thermodesulfitimonas autotrophica]|uniref:Uncharacterized protein n=1 Tax=Thermodesulfitimonas autotrophica TaxID=1894989 RepID=A0A3N5ABK3_9THEO|nr:hypothetical protein [Thermodesulfitimonas autotrophica]RPF41997.1 hypothetical protein EDD75_2218 [Thermodesulfitimonas autotrophica]
MGEVINLYVKRLEKEWLQLWGTGENTKKAPKEPASEEDITGVARLIAYCQEIAPEVVMQDKNIPDEGKRREILEEMLEILNQLAKEYSSR